jgi:hypothetical protein
MNATLAMMLSVLGVRVISLAALGIRLRAQTMSDRHRQRTLIAMMMLASHALEQENNARARTS